MAARRGLVEDLLEIGSRLRWQTALVAAAGCWVVLHLIALRFAPSVTVAGKSSSPAPVVASGFVYTVCSLMQFIVPTALCIGALVSLLQRGHGKALHSHVAECGLEAVQGLTWSQFETLIAEAFRRRGYAVEVRGGRTPDGGVDLELRRAGRTYLVQCKHWRTRQVGVRIVRELKGVIAAQKAAGGFVVTGGAFTRDAWHFAQDSGIELIDGEKFESLVREVERKRAQLEVPAAVEALPPPVPPGDARAPQCPKCGSAMVRRVAKQGAYAGRAFWGCTQFPRCRGTLNEGQSLDTCLR